MLDTINNWLSSERAGVSNLPAHVEPYLKHITEHKNEIGQTYITGMLGSNYKAAVSDSGISLKGSLAKYYLNDNCQTLTRSDSQRAIEMMSDELHLSIDKAIVRRIDFAQNFTMKYEPETYYNYFGQCPYFKRFIQPNSVYYNNRLKTIIFYNKIAEAKAKGLILPEVWQNQNVLRFELRFEKRLPEQFNMPEITANMLYNEKFYMDLVNRWIKGYEAVDKLNEINFNFSNMKTPNDFWNQLAIMQINQMGQPKALQIVDELKARKAFKNPEDYSRTRRKIKEFCKSPDMSTISELVSELDKKVRAVKMFYR